MDDKPSRAASPEHPEPVGEAAAWTVLAYLISGPLVYGGLGWLLDRWLGTRFLVVVGLIGGMALAIYLINFRYGMGRRPSSRPPAARNRKNTQG